MNDTLTFSLDRRFVWRGRISEVAGHDEWTLPRENLSVLLDDAVEIIVLDPLSFPWEAFPKDRLVLPFGIVIPDPATEAIVRKIIGARSWYTISTAMDRVYGSVRDAVSELHHRGAPSLQAAERKASIRALTDMLGPELSTVARSFAAASIRVLASGSDVDEWASAVKELPNIDAVVLDPADDAAVPEGEDAPPPEAAVVRIDDSMEHHDRVNLVRDAWHALPAGGGLVIVGDVVVRPGAPLPPSVTKLLTEIGDATGTRVNLEEMRSIRWPGEVFSRSVLLRYGSLVSAEEMMGER